MRKLTLAVITCGCLGLSTARTSGESYSPRVGQPHADFTLPGLADGQPISLSDFRGKKVLLIHFASW